MATLLQGRDTTLTGNYEFRIGFFERKDPSMITIIELLTELLANQTAPGMAVIVECDGEQYDVDLVYVEGSGSPHDQTFVIRALTPQS